MTWDRPRPATDAELYDHVQRLFGIGEWDALLAGEDDPWWKARGHEIAKIGARRKKLKVSVQELADAADYCKANGIVIHNVAWLYRHINDAKRFAAERRREAQLRELEDLIDEAIACERALPSSDWLDRLVRARGPYRREVYQAWLSHRESSGPSLLSSRSTSSGVEHRPASSA